MDGGSSHGVHKGKGKKEKACKKARKEEKKEQKKEQKENLAFLMDKKPPKTTTRGSHRSDDYSVDLKIPLHHELYGDRTLFVTYTHAEGTAAEWVATARRSGKVHGHSGQIVVGMCAYQGSDGSLAVVSLCPGGGDIIVLHLDRHWDRNAKKQVNHVLPPSIVSFLMIVGVGIEDVVQKLNLQTNTNIPAGVDLVTKMASSPESTKVEDLCKMVLGWVFDPKPEKLLAGGWKGKESCVDEMTYAARDAYLVQKMAVQVLRGVDGAGTADGN